MHREPRPDHHEIYFPSNVGPLKIIYAHPKSKLEVVCHWCKWSWMAWTEEECKERLQLHIWLEHSGRKEVVSRNALRPPGR